MAMASSRSSAAARHAKRNILIVVIVVGTIFFPLLTFFSTSFSASNNHRRPAPAAAARLDLPFQSSSKSQATSTGGDITVAADPARRRHGFELTATSGRPKCDCKTTARDEEADRVIQSLETAERSAAFEKIFNTDFWGGGESRSGPGSRIDYTANARLLIAHALKTYHVNHLLDAPCGDVNWQPLIEGFNSTRYTGYDIVPQIIRKNAERFKEWRNVEFARVDFVNAPITISPDLIVCRDGIQHNSLKDGVRGVLNLEASGAKYLVTNWHTETGRGIVPDNAVNMNVPFGGAYPINVFTHPFNFSRPEFFISEGVNGVNGDGKLVGVWKLPVLWKGDGTRFVVPQVLNDRVRKEVISRADVDQALMHGAAAASVQ